MATYTKTGTVGRDDVDLFTISGITVLPVNGDTFVFDGLAGADTLTLRIGGAYFGSFLSTNFTIPAVPDAFGQYGISGAIMSDIMVMLKLTSVEQLVFADKLEKCRREPDNGQIRFPSPFDAWWLQRKFQPTFMLTPYRKYF